MHILVELMPTTLVAHVAKMLKGASSHYINQLSGLGAVLYWQDGYGVTTLRKGDVRRVVDYILNQKQHHASNNLDDLLERIEGKM